MSGDADWSLCAGEHLQRLEGQLRHLFYHSHTATPVVVLFAAALAPTGRRDSAMTRKAAAMTQDTRRRHCFTYALLPRSGYLLLTTRPAETSHDSPCVVLFISYLFIRFDMPLAGSVVTLHFS